MAENSIIVPIFNGLRYLRTFWDAVASALPPDSEVIVVDDGSTEPVGDVTPKSIAGANVRFARNDYSLGYAGAVNRGIQLATGNVLFLLNTDLIVNRETLKAMRDTLHEDDAIGLVGCRLVFPQTGLIQHAGVGFFDVFKRHIFLDAPSDHPLVNKRREVETSTFALVALPRRTIDEVGLLDDRFFNSSEDMDYSLRVREASRKIVIGRKAWAYHWESLSGAQRLMFADAGDARFWGKWQSRLPQDHFRYMDEAWSHALDSGVLQPLRDTVLFDLTRDPFGPTVRKWLATKLQAYGQCEVRDARQRGSNHFYLHLPMLLPLEARSLRLPHVLLVDRYRGLLENAYWFGERHRVGCQDIIIDIFGNIVLAETLC